MIGNGFDKQLGLATGYDQFLDWYIQQSSDNDNIRNFKNDLKTKSGKTPWWSDAEKAMGEHAEKFQPKTVNQYLERIRDFKIQLTIYLKTQEDRCDFSDIGTIRKCTSDFLVNFHQDILLKDKAKHIFADFRGVQYNFLTFNYTNIFPNLIKITKEANDKGILYAPGPSDSDIVPYGILGNVLAMHGSLESKIIMGVNDISQLNWPPSDITKPIRQAIIKPEINQELGRSEVNDAEDIINKSDIIAVYGLRLGDTDAKWRAILGQWLQLFATALVVFGHDKLEDVHPLIPEDTLNYVYQKQLDFLKKLFPDLDTKTEEEIETLRQKILIINQTRHLNLSIVH